MKLRKLELKDAPLMLEWMHDPFVVQDLKTDFSGKTIEDCIAFIQAAGNEAAAGQPAGNEAAGAQAAAGRPENLHLAIANEQDAYMGTVSLKHITNDAAEFAITIRAVAMGKGYASYAMKEILKTGFAQYHLQKIYWCVDPENKRAIRFYDKNGYQRIKAPEEAAGYTPEEKARFLWYEVK